MDSGTSRKRPWEEASPIDPLPKRRDTTALTVAAGQHRIPPLPQHAGHYPHDSQTKNQRRLPPPLYVPSSGASSDAVMSGAIQLSTPAVYDWNISRPRSQSLFDVLNQPQQVRHDSELEQATNIPAPLDLNRSISRFSSNARHSQLGTSPAHAAGAGAMICCPPNCEGQACTDTRGLIRKLSSELVLLEPNLRLALRKDYPSFSESHQLEPANTDVALHWAFDLVQWTNASLQELINKQTVHSPGQNLTYLDTTSAMKRGHTPDGDEQSPPLRHHSGPPHGYSNIIHSNSLSEENRRSLYGQGYAYATARSPRHTPSSSGSILMLPQSPIQASQPSRSAMLPSPSSMSLSNVSSLPPISSPTMTSQSTAQTAHLQDLQHQVSVKTLSFQTLQREYDSLLQKLERQRRKSATLEKKFEVSDAEINSLTDERERLQSQVTSLENQIEELQQTRDEARSQLVANGTQYMRILEMANRLQTQSAEDKKRWEAEKSELEQRIRILEEAMVTGNIGNEESSMGANNDVGSNTPAPTTFSHPTSPPSTTSLAETVNVLRAEIGRLRSRNQNVEAALQSVRMESVYLQAAAKQLAESSGKIEKAAKDAIGG